ncbi:MAG: hypothetical protein AB7N65_21070 [Vicinamibacterales bacterium]
MRLTLKIGLVAAGYLTAFLAASAAVAVRVASTSGLDAQASSGMYAFGDAYVFVGVFGLLALVPTGAALGFLRSYRRFWVGLAALSVVIALTGGAAAPVFAFGRHAVPPSPWAAWSGLCVLRILVAPILAPAWLLFATLAPHRPARCALLAATALELIAAAYGGVVWFLPLVFGRT